MKGLEPEPAVGPAGAVAFCSTVRSVGVDVVWSVTVTSVTKPRPLVVTAVTFIVSPVPGSV